MRNFKIVISQDRKQATLYFVHTNKTLGFYDSYGNVMLLIENFLFNN